MAPTHRQRNDPINRVAVVDLPRILPPSRFPCVAEQVRAGDVVVMPDLAATHPREEALRPIRVGLPVALAFLVVGAGDSVPGVQLVPARGFVSVDHGPGLDVLPDERD